MQIIIGIIVVLLVIGIIANIIEWAKANIGIILLIIGAIASIFFFGFWKTLIGVAIIFGILLIFGWISNIIAAKNEEQLNNFLRSSCTQLGYMDAAAWRKQLPQFAGKSYTTSFESCTSQFAVAMEKKYITDDASLSWLDPAANYLKKAFAADVWGLEQVPSKGLSYTHSTPNGKLIHEAMDHISNSKIIDGKHLIQKTPLNAEGICKDHKFSSPEAVPEYYLHLYIINDYFRERSISKEESNFETEEISLDDL